MDEKDLDPLKKKAAKYKGQIAGLTQTVVELRLKMCQCQMIAGWEEDPKICESMIELSKKLKKYVSWITREDLKIRV